MGAIKYFSERIRFKIPHPRKTSNWISKIIEMEGRKLASLNIIFCNDEFLGQLNHKYLNHTTLTDIITFDYSKDAVDNGIVGEIFISIPRVRDNASKYTESFDSELNRVIIHGVLHLLGYTDKSPRQKTQMRKKEDSYLSLRS